MDRRAFLAAGATGLSVVTAGCSGVLGRTVDLTDPEIGTQDEGREKYLAYRHEDRRVVTLGFDQRTGQASPTDRFGFRISVPHSDATTIESFRFDLRAPITSIDPPAAIYLRAPTGGLWPDITYEQVENRWTRIALDDTGALGEGTLTLETIVVPGTVPADTVGIRADMELSDSGAPGRTYRLDARTEFRPVRV